jgi:DNA end-binding protein Ku
LEGRPDPTYNRNYTATTESEKVRFHQLNKGTGNRVRYRKVDEATEEEVEGENIVKAYEVSKGNYIQITDEDMAAVQVESTRTIDIDQFVPREEIDDLYNIRPYFIAPEGKMGAEAFVTIREAIAATGKVAIGRLVLTTREHMIALEPRGKGLMGTLLRYPYEVRDEAQFFEEIPDIKIDKEMLELAKHIVATKSAHFEPDRFEDRYEMALRDIIKRKAAGETITPSRPAQEPKVVNLMDALRRSLAAEQGEPEKPAKKSGSSRSKSTETKATPAKKARKSA